jgi:exonuclease
MSVSVDIGGAPGSVWWRQDVPAAAAYVVFDCETTGTAPGVNEIVSLAVVRLDGDGVEIARFVQLVRPSRPIPPEATAVHGIHDEDVARAPSPADTRNQRLPFARCTRARCVNERALTEFTATFVRGLSMGEPRRSMPLRQRCPEIRRTSGDELVSQQPPQKTTGRT